jgi:hypothetical protein
MVLIPSSITDTRQFRAIDAREAMNGVFDGILGFLHVWEEAIDPASEPRGFEVLYTDRPRRPQSG